jgi:hypothetical protein
MLNTQSQTRVLLILIILYALAAVLYVLLPGGALDMAATFGEFAMPTVAPWQLALANALVVLLLYIRD